MTLSNGQQAVVDTLAVPGKALMDIPQVANSITEGVNAFMDVVPGIVNALDELANIHPFIKRMGESAPSVRILIGDSLLSCRLRVQGHLHARNDASEQRSEGYCHLCRVRRARFLSVTFTH